MSTDIGPDNAHVASPLTDDSGERSSAAIEPLDGQTPAAHVGSLAEEPRVVPPQSIEPERDLIIPSIFLSGVAITLAIINPVYITFAAQHLLTYVLAGLGVLLLWAGVFAKRMPVLYAGAAVIMSVVTAGVISQPSTLGVPLAAIWPVRIVLVMLLAVSWGYLMQPPRWLNRALLAVVVPTVAIVAIWGGQATAVAMFGLNVRLPATNLAPYWIVVDNNGTLYASDAAGGLVWVFDSSGAPQGTIRVERAPAVGTPGPGILPNGYLEEMSLANRSILPSASANQAAAATATAVAATGGRSAFDFCGLAVDPEGNLYALDPLDPTGYKVLRFDGYGMITARLPTPKDYRPSRGCIAVDESRIVISSAFGQVYVLDHTGKQVGEYKVSYMPLGVGLHDDEIIVNGPFAMDKIDLKSGEMTSLNVPMPEGQLRVPYQSFFVEPDGKVLLADMANSQVKRFDIGAGSIVTSIGEAGRSAGQFQALGGIAEDSEGRIYVADWQSRVIQRFTHDGKLDAVWWAALSVPENQQVVEEYD